MARIKGNGAGGASVLITSAEVLLLDEDGTDLGFVSTTRALALAQERGLALVRLDDLSSPPRCQLLDAQTLAAETARADRLARATSAPPKELRYYSVARTDVEIPFEFSGIPMP